MMSIREKLKYSLPSYLSWIDDKTYLRIKYLLKTHRILHLNPPRTFNEKIQWLKMYDRDPIYSTMVDKYAVKKYVADRIGCQYIIPTLGVWECFDDINFDKLPNQFVLKCTHDSGGLIIVKDKSKLNISQAKRKLETSLKHNYYWSGREYPYKEVKPKIIAETYMQENKQKANACKQSHYDGLCDYKIHCINGEPQIIEIDFNRFVGHKRNLYTIDWEPIYSAIQYPYDFQYVFKKPSCHETMLQLARKLAANTKYLRTDFYIVDGKIYFGELTFYHDSGFSKINPISFDEELGRKLLIDN